MTATACRLSAGMDGARPAEEGAPAAPGENGFPDGRGRPKVLVYPIGPGDASSCPEPAPFCPGGRLTCKRGRRQTLPRLPSLTPNSHGEGTGKDRGRSSPAWLRQAAIPLHP